MFFDQDDIDEMQRRDREDEEQAQRSKLARDAALDARFPARTPSQRRSGCGPCPCECNSGSRCYGCGHAGCGNR